MDNIIAAYGGGFKPPTAGHFTVVKKFLNQTPNVDKFIIFVGGGERNGITQNESIQIWEIYKKHLPNFVEISPSKAPIGDVIRLGKNNPEDTVYFVIGGREGNEEDERDVESRTKNVEEKYPNMKVSLITTPDTGMSGTNARKAAKSNPEEFFPFLPDVLTEEEKQQIYDIVFPVITENLNEGLDVKANLKKLKGKFKEFIGAVKNEGKETKAAFKLLMQAASEDRKLTDDEKKQIGDQIKDVFKTLGYVGLFSLPGGSLVLLLLKWLKLNKYILPSSFAALEENEYHEEALSQTEKEALDMVYKNWDKFDGKICNSGFCDIYAKHLSKNLPGSKIMSTEEMGINGTLGHVWIEYENKFYDAEVPNGVNRLEDLPWMQQLQKIPSDIQQLNENTTYSSHIDYRRNIMELTKFYKNKYPEYPTPKLKLVHGDTDNAKDFFGKTAYYEPDTQTIVLYTEGRHPKDLVRSFSHEMIHHIQNVEGRLGNITTTNTNEDDHLLDLEKEAYMDGNINFRNWTDTIAETKSDPFGLIQFVKEAMDSDIQEMEVSTPENIKYWTLHSGLFYKLKEDPKSYHKFKTQLSGERLKALEYFWDILERGELSQ